MQMTDKALRDTINKKRGGNKVTLQLEPLATCSLVLTDVTFLLAAASKRLFKKPVSKAALTMLLCYRLSHVFGEG